MKRVLLVVGIVLLLTFGLVADPVTFVFGAVTYTLDVAEEYSGDFDPDDWP